MHNHTGCFCSTFPMRLQSACIKGYKITLVAFVSLFSMVDFQMPPQFNYPQGGIVTLVDFSPLWVFKWNLNVLGPEHTKSHWLHLLDFSPLWILKLFKLFMDICLAFLHWVVSNVSSNRLPERMHSHIGCNCWAFLHCVSSNVSSKCWHKHLYSYIDCICSTLW